AAEHKREIAGERKQTGAKLTLTLHTQTGKSRCARVIERHLRACSEQDLTYGQVLFILSQTARTHTWRALTRFS
ncbi:MAG: hypothetical protein OES18_09120, partial [Deltaproteobacteria bacterium]|nr:hypothetical protein [Deltaproteobacteria bacterium]